MGNKDEIGKNIKRLRESRNMSQARLAESVGCSPSTIAMYETGRREPDMDMIEAIADILNVRIIDIVPSKDTLWNPEDMAWAEQEDENTVLLNRWAHKTTVANRQQLLDIIRVMFKQDFDEEGNLK